MARHEIVLRPGDQAVISVPPGQAYEVTASDEEPESLGLFRDFTRKHASQIVDFTQGQKFEDGIDLFSQTTMQELTGIVRQLQTERVASATLQQQVEMTLYRSLHGNMGKEDIQDVARNFTGLVQEYADMLTAASDIKGTM